MTPIRRPGQPAAAALLLLAALSGVSGCAGRDAGLADKREKPELDCEGRIPDTPIVAPPRGCANRANLQAMVADPADLVVGRPLAPASGTQEARGVEAYRLGKVKPLSASGQIGTSDAATSATSATTPKAD